MGLQRFATLTVAIGAAVGGAACSSDDGGGAPSLPQSNVYAGIYSDAVASGTVDVTFASPVASRVHPAFTGQVVGANAPPVTATAVIDLGGTPVTLTGTVNTDNGDFSVTGGSYTCTGSLSNGVLEADCTGPNGPGIFSAFSDSDQVPVVQYCGTYQIVDPVFDTGDFNMMVAEGPGYLFVIARGDGGGVIPLVGRVRDGDVVDIDMTFDDPGGGGSVRANIDGQFYDDNADGQFDRTDGTVFLTQGGVTAGGAFFGTRC